MNYRSLADMATTIRNGLYLLPNNIDLVVGIPRSGVLAGIIVALHKNVKFTSLDAFLSNTPIVTGATREAQYSSLKLPFDAKHILLIDDSAASGNSMAMALNAINNCTFDGKITTCAIYLTPGCNEIDLHFEVLPQTRIFEWNLMHRPYLAQCCVDLDGVLCKDPTNEENDDGTQYLQFLRNACPLLLPTYQIGRIVTSRLEKYRAQTEHWLAQQQIDYGALDMLDLPNAQTRRRMRIHASFKSEIYAKHDEMTLFIESDLSQAVEIAKLTGKPTLSISTQEIINPGYTLAYAGQAARRWRSKVARVLNRAYSKVTG